MPARDSKGRFIKGGGSVTWVSDTITPNLIAFPPKMDAALGALMEFESGNVQDYMRSNAPWTDRTSNARGGLFAVAKSSFGQHTIVCYHTVNYGIWLEVAHGGKYRIIQPTVQIEGKRVMGSVRGLMKAMA